jgi:hypothetical protein
MIKFSLSLCLLVLITACSTNTNETTESVSATDEALVISESSNKFINEILGGGEGTIRGFDLGDPISKVKANENFEQFDEEENILSYTFETKKNEIVDVLYTYDASKLLSEVQLDIYLNSDSSAQFIAESLSHYFTQKYGQPIEGATKPTWSLKDDEMVELKIISKKLDKGLQVNFKKK